jgi:hypothetical protein
VTTDDNSETVSELSENERARFYRAADLTLREGGFVHSNFVLERSGVSCTEQQMIGVMRSWCESRDYPLNRIHTGRMGAILMGLVGCAALILGVVGSIEGNRGGRTIGHIALALSIPLIIGAVMLWRSTSRIRDEQIRKANTVCPECHDQLGAASSCGCGYLTVGEKADRSSPAVGIERDDSASEVAPLHALPEELGPAVWQVKSAAGVQSHTTFDEIRTNILQGDVNSTNEIRIVDPQADGEEPEWTPISELSESMYDLGMLYHPIKAHMARGGNIGASVGVAWWMFNMLILAFGELNNPVIGGIGVLTVWALANLKLPSHVRFFSSRVLWGAMVLGALFAFQNYKWDSIISSIATGVGMVAGALLAGAVVGWLLGAAVGTITGLIRRDSLELAPDATREDAKARLLHGVVVPLGVLVVLVLVYTFVAMPILEKIIGE